MSDSPIQPGYAAFRQLGLIGNPFVSGASEEGRSIAASMEIQAAAHALLTRIVAESERERPKPIWVEKGDVPSLYHLAAISLVEHSLLHDESISVLHAYVPMFMLRLGRIRSSLQVLSERLVMRDFDLTLAAWLHRVVGNPDTDLPQYGNAEAEITAWADEFESSPNEAVSRLFGGSVLERDQAAALIVDSRSAADDADVEESDSTPEVIEGDPMPPSVQPPDTTERDDAIVEYLLAYTKEHLSPVIARSLRVYRQRGLAALSTEMNRTRAPRKTLGAVSAFACKRFNSCALIYDQFANWAAVPEDLRTGFITALSEIRLALGGNGVIVVLAATDEIPDVEDQIRGLNDVMWAFSNLAAAEEEPDGLRIGMIESWLASATVAESAPLDLTDPVLSSLFRISEGSLARFVGMAAAAFDSAALRGADHLDEIALQSGLSVMDLGD